MKDYLSAENARNKRNAGMYERLLRQALVNLGYQNAVSVLCGHHIVFELDGKLDTENEIPSADTLLFDHELMTAVFGDEAIEVMVMLATQPAEQRDEMLVRYMSSGHYPVRIKESSHV